MIPNLVLDTNAVLDWLVFTNPASQVVTEAITEAHVRWIVNAAVRDELAHVLARGVVDRWQPDLSRLWGTWERYAVPVEHASPAAIHCRPQCTDVDDQKFIELALDHEARWLITRDRALLKLARRARSFGLSIVTPDRFMLTPHSGTPT